MLQELDLPSIDELLFDLPSKYSWQAHIKSILHNLLNSRLIESAVSMSSLSEVALIPFKGDARPHPLVSLFRDDISLSRHLNKRLRLLLHCPGLNKDTSKFHARPNRDLEILYVLFVTLKLRMCSISSSVCSALQSIRDH